jgi:N-acetylmuramoyl-L-alanine amidase
MNFGQILAPGSRGDAVIALQKSLREYGYGVEVNGDYDSSTFEVVTAFQRHFRPERVDGHADPSTRSTLQELLASRGRPRAIAARARTAMLRTAP